jgi:anti-sigma factor ChrR (cupin superfamily)
MMSEDPDQIVAAYALGITRGSARKEIESRLRLDPALQAKAELWQSQLAALDLAAPREAPPAALLARILDEIGTDQPELAGTVTRRAGSGVWTEMAPGVTYTVLFEDPIAKRRSILIRAQPGATYDSHQHDEGYEECLVVEGDLIMGELRLLAGDFHLAAKGSAHPTATTVSGCLLYLSTAF